MARLLLVPALVATALASCDGGADRGDPDLRVDTLPATDGTPIVYDVRGRGDVALVFIHCWACNRSFWRDQAEAFAPAYRVVTLDLAGHGASGVARVTWSLSGLADDVAALVRALELPRVVLVGHSLGGPVALLAAARLPGVVMGVACVEALHDVTMRIDEATAERMLALYERDYAGTMRRMVGFMFPPSTDTALVSLVAAAALDADTAATLGLVRDYPNLDLATALTQARVPVRCINAAPTPPMGQATALETNRRYGDFDAVLMNGVGHYPYLERPAEFDDLLRQILNALGARPDTIHD